MKNQYKFLCPAVMVLAFYAAAAAAGDVEGPEILQDQVAADSAAVPDSIPVTMSDGMAGAYLSSQFAKATGDIGKAIRYLRSAQRENPGNADISLQLQSMLLLNGDVEEAITLAENIPQAEHVNPISSLLVSLHAVKQGRIDHANAVLNGAFDANSGQLWLPLVSAWLDISLRKPQKPITLEGMSSDAGRATSLVQYHLALLNSYAGFKDAAALNFKNAVDDPVNPPAHVMDMLLRFYDDNNAPAALTPLVETYRKLNPGQTAPDASAAITTPQDGIAEVLFTMGSIMQGAGIPQDAVIYLQMTRYLKPNFPLATLGLGDAYSDFKQYDKANAMYAMFNERSALYNKAALRLAVNYNQAGKFRDAIALLDKISRNLPQRSEALVAKGDLLRTHSRFGEAADAYSQALQRLGELDSQHWPILFARGVCFERQGKWKAAEQDMQKALTLKPDQPDVLNYLGYTWLTRRERVDEAREMLEKAVRLRPNDPQIIDSMGWALFSLKQYKDAALYLEKALELLPSDPTINDHLGDVYWQLGRKIEARFQWERSLSFLPDGEETGALRRKLKQGLAASAPSMPPVIADGSRPEIAVP